jgi:hypothetical protein
MRSLALLGLIALSTLPLAARDRDHDRGPWRGRESRRMVVEARPMVYDRAYGRPYDRYDRYDRDDDGRYEDRRNDERWEGRACRDDRLRYRAYDEDDDFVVVRPRRLIAPWQARVVLRFGR